jgi:hypothetical protein
MVDWKEKSATQAASDKIEGGRLKGNKRGGEKTGRERTWAKMEDDDDHHAHQRLAQARGG